MRSLLRKFWLSWRVRKAEVYYSALIGVRHDARCIRDVFVL